MPLGLVAQRRYLTQDKAAIASLAQTMVDAAALPMPVEELETIIKQDEAERLYQVQHAHTTQAETCPPLLFPEILVALS